MTAPENAPSVELDVFDRVLVEIDETPASLVAAAQAACVAAPGAEVELLAVVERFAAAHAGAAARHAADRSEAATAAALDHARSLVPGATSRFVAGRERAAVVDEADTVGATLVVIGTHGHGRLTAKLFGTLDAGMLRDAPCSVLVARPGWGPAKPHKIVVGKDGSEQAALAERAARRLGERLGVPVQVVVALGGKTLPETVFAPAGDDTLVDPRDPVEALAAAATECDLLVLGHRGAHGGGKLGRVAEKIVYGARSSVLVVRAPADE
jgi:nucleotide-binding universal stress UspA family protein